MLAAAIGEAYSAGRKALNANGGGSQGRRESEGENVKLHDGGEDSNKGRVPEG